MRCIVITGVDRGLGLALAHRLLAAGHRVFGMCLEPDGDGPRSLVARHSERCTIVRLDQGSGESIAQAAAAVRSRTPVVDWLVNNAGILGDIERSIDDPELDFENILEVVRINALGALRVTHAFWPLVASSSDTRLIVNISSEAGSIGQNWRDRWFGYAMSKAALNMAGALVHTRLRELGGRVMQVHPGYLKSYMHGARNEKATFEPDEAVALILGQIEHRLNRAPTPQPEFFDLHGNDLPW